ncbi:50S ribosomal protein L29 [Candidatus Woesearchaeota archaeon]|nr:50S ribosomal protein L29 [Candidatus Woesearchaeota archaeon]
MKIAEIRQMGIDDLKGKLAELEMEMIKQYGVIAKGTIPKSPSLVRNTKRTIAKIFMVLEEKKKQQTEVTQKT